jgi:hypothetical protein
LVALEVLDKYLVAAHDNGCRVGWGWIGGLVNRLQVMSVHFHRNTPHNRVEGENEAELIFLAN